MCFKHCDLEVFIFINLFKITIFFWLKYCKNFQRYKSISNYKAAFTLRRFIVSISNYNSERLIRSRQLYFSFVQLNFIITVQRYCDLHEEITRLFDDTQDDCLTIHDCFSSRGGQIIVWSPRGDHPIVFEFLDDFRNVKNIIFIS